MSSGANRVPLHWLNPSILGRHMLPAFEVQTPQFVITRCRRDALGQPAHPADISWADKMDQETVTVNTET